MSDEGLTQEEEEYLMKLFRDEMGEYPKQDEKPHIISLFKKIIAMSDNTKTGNVAKDELGFVRIPVRTNLDLSHYCEAMGMGGFSNYFKADSQIILGTSLSKDGFLDKLAVTQKRESELKKKTGSSSVERRGLFSSKSKTQEEII